MIGSLKIETNKSISDLKKETDLIFPKAKKETEAQIGALEVSISNKITTSLDNMKNQIESSVNTKLS